MQEPQTKEVMSFDLLNGKVIQTSTILIQNIDTQEWIPIKRTEQNTGLTADEFEAAVEKQKVENAKAHADAQKELADSITTIKAKVAPVAEK